MAEKTVRIEGTVPTSPSGTQNVAVTGQPLSFYMVQNPSLTGAYVYSQAEIAGVAAANNYMTLVNPVGSGKTLVFAGAFISSFIVGDTAATITSMRGYRCGVATGGVVSPTNTVGKFQTSQPNPVGEIRTGNPAVTFGTALFNSPPYIGAAKSSSPFVHQVPIPPQGGLFTLTPGEGLVLRAEVGDVDTRWNLSLAWGEI